MPCKDTSDKEILITSEVSVSHRIPYQSHSQESACTGEGMGNCVKLELVLATALFRLAGVLNDTLPTLAIDAGGDV